MLRAWSFLALAGVCVSRLAMLVPHGLTSNRLNLEEIDPEVERATAASASKHTKRGGEERGGVGRGILDPEAKYLGGQSHYAPSSCLASLLSHLLA